jgi:hypothetical protein
MSGTRRTMSRKPLGTPRAISSLPRTRHPAPGNCGPLRSWRTGPRSAPHARHDPTNEVPLQCSVDNQAGQGRNDDTGIQDSPPDAAKGPTEQGSKYDGQRELALIGKKD